MKKYFILLSTSLLLYLFFPAPIYAQSTPLAITTFNSIGIYWNPGGGSSSNTCSVKYRTSGGSWKNGYPLWYAPDGQYRGSIVNLAPDTTYEIQLTLGSGTSATFTTKTWSENFTIDPGKIHYLSANSSSTLTVSDSGTPNGYALYAPEPGKSVTIDVANNQNYNVSVNASYVIIRGLKLVGGAKGGIYLSAGVHDVVIEKNEITYWGAGTNTWGYGAITGAGSYGSVNAEMKRIIIQRNKFHNPRGGSNNWSTGHPQGPQVVELFNTGGNHVIRYNEAFSNSTSHYFNDILGAGSNYDYSCGNAQQCTGFPGPDTDIYGNYLSNCWDDAIEADGFGKNIRIWGNYLTNCLDGVSIAEKSRGPIYIWRNVLGVTERSPNNYGGGFIKNGGPIRAGQVYVFHNTTLQPNGAGNALYNGPTNYNLTRNNIFEMQASGSELFRSTDSTNDINYDLYYGDKGSWETNGIPGKPEYIDSKSLTNGYFLKPSSKGYNAGIPLPNFNDDSAGAPDMGTYEAGKPPLQFGVNAYLTVSSSPTPSSCPLAFLGDFNCDGYINENDLNALLISWLTGGKDLTGDGKVNESDLNKLLGNWKTR